MLSVAQLKINGSVTSLNLVDFSMHVYDQVGKNFLSPAKLLTTAFETVCFSEMF